MKRLTALTLTAALAVSATPALSWYQGALKHRDYMVDAALVFAYYEKCNAGPIPSDLKGRAEENVCRQSISDSWLGNLRECLAHLV